jgi:hypothetical protein
MPNLKKQNPSEESQIMIPENVDYNFDQKEIETEIEISLSYLKRFYDFMLVQDGSRFILYKNQTSEKIEVNAPIPNVIVLHAHHVVKLTLGILHGKAKNDWNEDDRTVLAISYRNPKGQNYKSFGSFDPDYIEWITDKSLYDQLIKRVYVYMLIKGKIIPASFGITSYKSLSSTMSVLKSIKTEQNPYGFPISAITQNITLVPDKSRDNFSYDRVVFEPVIINENERKYYHFHTPKHKDYKDKIQPYIDQIKSNHAIVISESESAIITEAILEAEDSETLNIETGEIESKSESKSKPKPKSKPQKNKEKDVDEFVGMDLEDPMPPEKQSETLDDNLDLINAIDNMDEKDVEKAFG